MAAKQELSVADQLAAIQLERAALQLELEREQVATLRANREQRLMTLYRQRRDLEEAQRNARQRQSQCAHKKGGQGVEGIDDGNREYAVIKHTYAHGAREVMCQRCQKIWAEPPLSLKKTDPAEYRREMSEWKEALRFSTDNTDSGKQLFVITSAA